MPTQPPAPSIAEAPADVVRRQYAASATGDLDLWRTAVAPDVEWIEAAGFPLAGTYRTPHGVISGVFEQLAAAWDDWITHDDTYLGDGERVIVLGRYSAVSKATGKAMSVRVAHSFIVRGGKIVRFEQIVDSAGVRAAMTA